MIDATPDCDNVYTEVLRLSAFPRNLEEVFLRFSQPTFGTVIFDSVPDDLRVLLLGTKFIRSVIVENGVLPATLKRANLLSTGAARKTSVVAIDGKEVDDRIWAINQSSIAGVLHQTDFRCYANYENMCRGIRPQSSHIKLTNRVIF